MDLPYKEFDVQPCEITTRISYETGAIQKGISTRTEGWYWQSWKVFESVLDAATPDTLTKTELIKVVEALRARDVSPITVNTYARALNAFFKWLHVEGHCMKLVQIPRLKEPETVIATLKPDHIQRLMQTRPECHNQRRAQMVALTILDTGLRLKEALAVRRDDVDFDNLLLTVRNGKGGKQRVVPMSCELRKILSKFMSANVSRTGLVFFSGEGSQMLQNNIRRDFGQLCSRVRISGVKGGFHCLRHTFAVNYVRNGGDVFRLQRILGHSTLDMTRRYVDLQTADLQAVHEKLSVLNCRL